jgi:HAE1 family hydrophobic/amphiphilic exporter-1
MFLSDLSIKRPVLASVLMLSLVTLGVFSYRRLAVDLYPDVELPFISVITVYPGAAPESVEREVSKVIEEAVNPIAGVRKVGSVSREGVSQVWVEFELGVKVNDAAQEARAKVASIRGELPQAIEEPVVEKLDVTGLPVASLAVRSPSLPPRELTELVEKKIQRRLQSISGVGKVDLVGTARREVTVALDPTRLDALGMGVDEVIAGLQWENLNTPLGRLTYGNRETPLRIDGKPKEVRDLAEITIGQRGGRPVRLGEVAEVLDGVEEPRSLALVNGEPGIGIDVLKQSGANVVQVVDAVKAEIARLQGELPPGVHIEMVRDGSTWIRDSVHDVQETLILGGLLTVLIVFVFLNSWRSTVITGLTLPISVISSFIIMNFAGMTLNVMTLMALSLAIGLLIDDAIVVRENIVRHLERGEDHFTAARQGTAEIGLAVLATTMSIVAVFVPVAFMKGIVGRFFFQFGITVAFAVLVSLLVAFTLDPMLSSRWHDPDIQRQGRRGLLKGALDRFNAAFDRTADRYRGLIAWALDHRRTVMGAATAAFLAGAALFVVLPSEFFPSFDEGEFQVVLTTAPDASLAESENRLRAALAVLDHTPDVVSTYATIGAGDTGTVRDASIYVKLAPRRQRSRSQAQIQRDLRERLQRQVAGILISFTKPSNLDTRKPLMALVRGEDVATLKEIASRLKRQMYAIPGVVDVEMSLEHDTPEYRLVIDRERARDVGLATGAVARTLAVLVGGQAVTTWEDADGDAVDVRLRLPEQLRRDPEQVRALRMAVPDAGGRPALVPLAQLARYEVSASPSEIVREQLSRQVVVSANLDGVPLGTAVARVRAVAAGLDLPPGYRIEMGGENEHMEEDFRYLGEALLLAVLMVYLILAAQFESFLDPLAIMLSLPLSIVGMAGMLALTGDTINIMSLIGLIMLMGLVTKNAILLIDFTKTLRRRGMTRREAVIEAGRTRLRPIIMTTLAMIFGMMPLALGIGAGGEMRAPMARAIVGGLITSTLLTLIVVPVVYTLLDDALAWARRRRVAPVARASAAAAVLLAVAVAAPAAAAAEAPRVLTLEQALALAQQRSREILKAVEYGHWGEGRYLQERAAALPRLTVTASAGRASDAAQRAMFGEFAQFIPTMQDQRVAQLGLSQALFTWGQVGAAIRAAKVALATADDRLRAARQAVRRDVTAAFYDVLLAREMAAIARESLAQRQRHLAEAQHRLELGTATDYDVLAAQVAVDNARPEVIRAENMVATARANLRFLLALEEEVEVEGVLEAHLAPVPQYHEALAAALAHRPELAELANLRRMQEEVVHIARAGDKPRLDLAASYGWRQLDAGGTRGTGAAWHAGVYLSFPVFDGFKTAGQVTQARADYRTAQLEEEQARDRIALQVRTAVDAVGEAAAIVQALTGTVAQAERLLWMTEQGFELGVMRRLEVQDAQLALAAARANLARAQRDYLVARVTLEWVCGTLGETATP